MTIAVASYFVGCISALYCVIDRRLTKCSYTCTEQSGFHLGGGGGHSPPFGMATIHIYYM